MKVPKRIADILARKDAFLTTLQNGMDKDIAKLQAVLFQDIISLIVPKLEVKNGVIVDSAENYKLLRQIDKTFESFNNGLYKNLVPTINEGATKLAEISNKYFEITLTGDLPQRFAKVLTQTKFITDLRFGLLGGKAVRGGYIMTLINQSANMDSIKRMMVKAITGNASMKDFINAIKTELLGEGNQLGKLERQFKRYAYDVYQQHDASYNAKLAEEFNLKYFIYQGGLVKDSRDFCREHNGYVYTTEEAKKWSTWTPKDAIHITEFEQKNLSQHPGYMDYEGYDPLVDRGGYNCRHILGYINEALALRLRPDLADKKKLKVVK